MVRIMNALPADYHIHSSFSGDSSEKFENITKNAIKKGLTSICITDHQDFGFYADGILFELDKDEYFNYMLYIQDKYKETIDIRIGVETGLEVDKAVRLKEFVNRHPYDFVIGSSHLINGFDPYYPEYFNGKTERQAFIEYFESIVDNLKVCSDFDVYGHIDYVVRYAPSKDKNYIYHDYSDILDEILKTIIQKGKGIEVNTSGLRSGLNNPNPSYDIIRRYRELGGEILTFGSDAHKAQDIAWGFDETVEKVKACGFKYYCEFKNRKPEFISLS